MNGSPSMLAAAALIASAIAIAAAPPAAAPPIASAQSISPDEARAIAKEATLYGFPLVDSYRIQYSYFIDRSDPEFKAPLNTIGNTARAYAPDDKTIATANSSTSSSFLGADLRAEPLVLTVPAVENGRSYSLRFIDMYTLSFAYVESRTTGNGAGNLLLAGPSWKGNAPPGIDSVIRSETEFAFVLYRTQLLNAADIDNVQKIQTGYKVQALSQFLGRPAPPAPPALDFMKPLGADEEWTSLEFFNILDFVLRFCPPHPSEAQLMARLAKLGIGVHGTFDAKSLPREVQEAMLDGMADAWTAFEEFE